jgi:hypothetical protein
MIEVAVGKDNGLRGSAEALVGPLADIAGGKGEAGVDQSPGPAAVNDSENIDEQDAEAEDIVGDIGEGNDILFGKGDGGHEGHLGKGLDCKKWDAGGEGKDRAGERGAMEGPLCYRCSHR